MMSFNDQGSQFPKFHFPCNEEERLAINSLCGEYNSTPKNYKSAKASLSSSQLYVASLLIVTFC